MTILYRPVLIKSAEQAEALPIGTLARHAAGSDMDHAHKLGPLPGFDNSFMWISLSGPVAPLAMVGWTALVPIEAEECHSEDYGSYHLMEAVGGSKPFITYLVDQEEA